MGTVILLMAKAGPWHTPSFLNMEATRTSTIPNIGQ